MSATNANGRNNGRPNNNNSFLDVASGLTPSRQLTRWEISTRDIEKFITDRFLQIENEFKRQGQNPPHIDIELSDLELGRNLHTLVLILPMDVLEKTSFSSEAEDIFRDELENGEYATLKPYYQKLLIPMMYDKRERGDFNNPKWRREARIKDWTGTDILRRFAQPKIEQLNRNGSDEPDAVVLLLNPLRVFSMMLRNAKFYERICCTVRQVTKGTVAETAVYTVDREVLAASAKQKNSRKMIQRLLRNGGARNNR